MKLTQVAKLRDPEYSNGCNFVNDQRGVSTTMFQIAPL